MPEMYFDVTWPNGRRERCYSPSRLIAQHFTVGASYGVDEFVLRVRRALHLGAQRVQAKYGFYCSEASDQLAYIERTVAALSRTERAGLVRVDAFEYSPSR